jgi:lipoprotein signal peptidase
VIDRSIYGAVADFFHFYAFGHDWYVFNVADAAITVGVVCFSWTRSSAGEGERREPVIRNEAWR